MSNMIIMNTETWNLRAKRMFRAKKITHKAIAARFGLSPSAITLKLNGERDSTWGDIQLFAEILGVTAISLVDDDPTFAQTELEAQILRNFRKMDEAEQAFTATRLIGHDESVI